MASKEDFMSKIGNLSTKDMVKIAILGAIGAILMLFRFPLPFAPPFMDIDISEVPVLIGGFVMGPVAGVFIVFIKLIIKFLTQGSSTGGVGELSNFIISSAFVVTTVLIYNRNRTMKNAVVALIAGVVSMTILATLSNYFFIFPLYGIDIGEFGRGFSGTNPLVSGAGTFILFSMVPFNLIKGTLVSVVVMLLYKHIAPLLKKY